MEDVFRPIEHLLIRKVEQEAQIAIAAKNLEKHLNSAPPDDAQQDVKDAWIAETVRLGDVKEEKEKPTSFADKGEFQQAWIDTADYADRYFSTGKSEMRVYYICRHFQGKSKAEVEAALLEEPPRSLNLGNFPYGCNTCMPSKIWKKKNLDEAQARQRWY